MTDPVDEWVVQALTEYNGKPLKSTEKGDLELDKVDEKQSEVFNALFGFIKGQLEDKVREVKPSARLTDSLACLSGDAMDMSHYMEKILKASGQKVPPVKRVLELNIDHPALGKIKALFESDRSNPKLKAYSEMLYDLAVIGEGGKLENPARFAKMVGDFMTHAAG
jgi:molecular chaperone HtpG